MTIETVNKILKSIEDNEVVFIENVPHELSFYCASMIIDENRFPIVNFICTPSPEASSQQPFDHEKSVFDYYQLDSKSITYISFDDLKRHNLKGLSIVNIDKQHANWEKNIEVLVMTRLCSDSKLVFINGFNYWKHINIGKLITLDYNTI